ncbi:Translation factor guf1 mitochondrial [Borealophlyctis nickersoniae]|nr:Translation factor guf1 mitochondrial [Borealophlyctis nickersoniae]
MFLVNLGRKLIAPATATIGVGTDDGSGCANGVSVGESCTNSAELADVCQEQGKKGSVEVGVGSGAWEVVDAGVQTTATAPHLQEEVEDDAAYFELPFASAAEKFVDETISEQCCEECFDFLYLPHPKTLESVPAIPKSADSQVRMEHVGISCQERSRIPSGPVQTSLDVTNARSILTSVANALSSDMRQWWIEQGEAGAKSHAEQMRSDTDVPANVPADGLQGLDGGTTTLCSEFTSDDITHPGDILPKSSTENDAPRTPAGCTSPCDSNLTLADTLSVLSDPCGVSEEMHSICLGSGKDTATSSGLPTNISTPAPASVRTASRSASALSHTSADSSTLKPPPMRPSSTSISAPASASLSKAKKRRQRAKATMARWASISSVNGEGGPNKKASKIQKSEALDLKDFPPENIRNFSIIAHIDHGKSTLADRLLEMTGTITKDSANKQVLDKLKVERERGITVKAQTASMFYTYEGKEYLLNLIDTPGHVDFSYEVSRSLAACQGTILLVDASQGIQAQTVANFFLAFGEGLTIVPVLNKIDLPAADPEKIAQQIETAFEVDTSSVIAISAKSGIGVDQILPRIIEEIPPPSSDRNAPFRALLFDTWYDKYVGVVCLVAVKDGRLKKGDKVISAHSQLRYEVNDLGLMYPEQTSTDALYAGQVGYVILGMKTTRDAHIGDTFHHENQPCEPFPGFQPAKSMVFAGMYPMDTADFVKLEEALDRLTLNDSSVTVARETSAALGQGFRLGFLGTLHMDVFKQRLEEEHDSEVLSTAPTVPYLVKYNNGTEKVVMNPAAFPEADDRGQVAEFCEPMVSGTLIFPAEYLGGLMELCGNHRGELQDYTYIDDNRVMMKYTLPMSEILTEFYDQLKSRSSGYASFDYEETGYSQADLVKINILLNGKPVDALASIVHRSQAVQVSKDWVKRLKGVMHKQLFEIIIQASCDGKIMARESISAARKDVTAKCYGGDITRKMKLLQKQKEGKKRMKTVAGGVELSQEAFLSLMKGEGKK